MTRQVDDRRSKTMLECRSRTGSRNVDRRSAKWADDIIAIVGSTSMKVCHRSVEIGTDK